MSCRLDSKPQRAHTANCHLLCRSRAHYPHTQRVPDAKLSFDADASELVCRYDPRRLTSEDVNRSLLPALLAQCDVSTVTRGSDLESAYLKNIAEPPA